MNERGDETLQGDREAHVFLYDRRVLVSHHYHLREKKMYLSDALVLLRRRGVILPSINR